MLEGNGETSFEGTKKLVDDYKFVATLKAHHNLTFRFLILRYTNRLAVLDNCGQSRASSHPSTIYKETSNPRMTCGFTSIESSTKMEQLKIVVPPDWHMH
jgi:hypothetical protein